MNTRSPILMAAGLALVLAVPAAAAWSGPDGAVRLAQAQTDERPAAAPEAAPPASAPGPGPNMMMRMMQGMGGPGGGHGGPESHLLRMCESADAHHAGMLAYAEVRLKITDAQKPAWAKFTEAAKAAHANLTKLCDLKDQPAPKTLPEKLARAERFAQARLAHIQTLRPALDELYKALTPEQQKVADTLHLDGPGPHGHHGHHGE